MPNCKNLLLFFNIFFLNLPLHANEWASYVPPDHRWVTISYDDEKRHLIAKLPGRLEESIKNDNLCFFHSTHQDTHYAIYFNPSLFFRPPKTVESFSETFGYLKEAQIIALQPNQTSLVYMLEINIFDVTPPSILRVFATDKALYYAVVSGADLSLAKEFFDSIIIE